MGFAGLLVYEDKGADGDGDGNDDNVGMAKSGGFWEIEWGGSVVSLHSDGGYMGDT